MKGVETGIDSMSRSANGTTMPMNKMNGALRALATQATHTSGPIGSVLTTLGMFTLGSGPVALALIAIAALAKGYDLLTSKAREAAKEQKTLAAGLSRFRPTTGPESETDAAFKANLQERLRIAKEMRDVETATVSSPGFKARRLAELTAEYQRLGKERGWAMRAAITELDTVNVKTEKATSAVAKMIPVVQEMAFSWKSAFEYAEALSETIQNITLRDARAMLGPGAVDVNANPGFGSGLRDFGTNVSGIDPLMGLTDEQKIAWQKITANQDKNSDKMTSAIAMSASMIAGTIGQALGVGGGGKGSQLGGGLGAALGGAFGGTLGWAGGPIGGLLGGVVGSAIGGLFDSNTKATNANTQATIRLTETMLNPVSGYKTAGARFDATEIRTSHQRYLTRGGTPILGTV